jgi:predicted RecA/RadA family phage recombinase
MTNENFDRGDQINVAVASGVVSGDPVMIGGMAGIAMTTRDATLGTATVKRRGVDTFSVKGVNDAGNVAVAALDPIYYLDGDTPKLSKKASGKFFGYALATVGSGSTASIQVLITGGAAVGLADAGVHTLIAETNGQTAVTILGATLAQSIKILGAFLISKDTTAGNITLAFTSAGSVVVIAKGTAAGVLVGGVSLTNTVGAAGDTLSVVSSSAGDAHVFIVYQVLP